MVLAVHQIAYFMLFASGLVCLIKGSDYVTVYASKLAKHCGVSQLVIGITIVAMSTSLPELTVSVFSVAFEAAQIATGTIIGSNIANICLIVGISASMYPIKTGRNFLKQGLFTLLFTLAVVLFLLDGMFFYEGLIILAGFLAYMCYLIRMKRHVRRKTKGKKVKITVSRRKMKTIRYTIASLVGGMIVVFGAQTLIFSTINIASMFGVSEMLISLIAIAIGTSLPELAVSFTAAIKKLEGISLGNILGSNIFNIAILGIVSLFYTVPVTGFLVLVNLPIMLVSTVILLAFIGTRWRITRINGIILLSIYALFVWLQFM